MTAVSRLIFCEKGFLNRPVNNINFVTLVKQTTVL